jgi:hypothetical protein
MLQMGSLTRQLSCSGEEVITVSRLSVVLILSIVLLAATALPAQASPPQPLYMEKVFPSAVYPTENVCDIRVASPFSQLVGGAIFYNDRYASATKEIARVVVEAGDGSGTLVGQVRWLGSYGLFTFGQGKGSLKGVHATGRVDVKEELSDGSVVYMLNGTYHIEPH